VREAVQTLGYRKNMAAVELVTMKSKVVAVILPDTKTTFSNKIIEGIQNEALKADLSVIILYIGDNDPEMQRRALDTVIERSVAGILLLSVELTHANQKILENAHINYVFASSAFAQENSRFIASDDFKIGYEATNFLIREGHQRIGLAALEPDTFVGQQRLLGYLQALKEHSFSFDKTWICAGNYSYYDGVNAMKRYGPDTKLTAIIGASDLAAIGIINQAKKMGLSVPQQLSVMSIDGTDIVNIVDPTLTSVTQSFYTMGVESMRMLLNPKLKSKYTKIEIKERESTRRI
ncbi:MAG: substrate-binding domain-containing protein, partial [Oenococcus kitaharae]